MEIVVITDDNLKDELLAGGLNGSANIVWTHDIETIPKKATAYIDLLFDTDREKRKKILGESAAEIVAVNDVAGQPGILPANFIRINGWPTFLKRAITEAGYSDERIKEKAEKLFTVFNKKIEWTTGTEGFITPRVICAIINEAYFSINDNVSTRDEIDTAMKLGTNYPYGPFEWCRLIGIQHVYSLLVELSKNNTRYTPCDLLKKEATF